MERTFTEAEVRRLLFIIGSFVPLSTLGDVFEELGRSIALGEHLPSHDLMKIARGVWVSNGTYYVGYGDEPNCDKNPS